MDSLRRLAEQILSALEEHDQILIQQPQLASPLATNIDPPPEDEDQGTRHRRRSGLAAH